jgi:outer membrane protein assembly factor BamA
MLNCRTSNTFIRLALSMQGIGTRVGCGCTNTGSSTIWLRRSTVIVWMALFMVLAYSAVLHGQTTEIIFTDSSVPAEASLLADPFARKGYRTKGAMESGAIQLVNALHRAGYLTAATDSVTIAGDTVRAWIHCGPKISTSIIRVRVIDSEPSEGLREVVLTASPGVLPANSLAQYTIDLLRNGYPTARTTITSMVIAGDTLITLAQANPGRHYLWDTLEVKGSLSINNLILQRLLRIRSEQPYDKQLLTGIDRHLNTLSFITRKGSYSLILTDDGKARVVLPLDKQPASNFNGIIGFGPNQQDPQKLVLSGDLSLQLVNAFARAEEMSMKWTGIQGDQQLTLQYRQPYLTFLPFGIMGRFHLFRKGELYYTLQQRCGVMVVPAPGRLFTTWVQLTNSRVLDRSVFDNALKLPAMTDYTTRMFGIEYRIQQLDFATNPSSGVFLRGELGAGSKELLTSTDIPENLFEGIPISNRHAMGQVHLEFFIPLTSRWVIRPAIQGSGVYGNGTTENSLFLIGGINTIRGFDEQSIRASSYALGSLEIRYRFEQESHFKLFLDGGWTEVKLPATYQKDTPYGFGAGLTLPSPAGILQVSYAWGIQQGNPLDFRTGRLHFGLDARF